MGAFTTNFNVGGTIDEIKKISFPENLMPNVNCVGTKGFRLVCDGTTNPVTAKYTFDKDVYLTDIEISCSEYDDLDFWEFQKGSTKMCETMYTQELPKDSSISSGFQIYPKVIAGTEVTVFFYNNSGIAKTVWATLGYMFNDGD